MRIYHGIFTVAYKSLLKKHIFVQICIHPGWLAVWTLLCMIRKCTILLSWGKSWHKDKPIFCWHLIPLLPALDLLCQCWRFDKKWGTQEQNIWWWIWNLCTEVFILTCSHQQPWVVFLCGADSYYFQIFPKKMALADATKDLAFIAKNKSQIFQLFCNCCRSFTEILFQSSPSESLTSLILVATCGSVFFKLVYFSALVSVANLCTF